MSRPATPPPTTAVLHADAVSVTLAGRRVLQEVTLGLQTGGWTAIVGPNGAGKSTLLATLAGLRRPDGGTVRLKGTPLPEWSARRRAREIAWLGQHGDAEGEIAARDVVLLGRLPHRGLFDAPDAQDAAVAHAAMRETECEAFALRRLSALSGGERQRVLIARAFSVQAPVLLLDEPTTHLDAPHQQSLARSLRARARAGVTVVTVLHDLNLALTADRIAVLDAGRLRAEGTTSDPQVHRTLETVFRRAIRIVRSDGSGAQRWFSLPQD
jgi:iron complex transport system ATP-binding protein